MDCHENYAKQITRSTLRSRSEHITFIFFIQTKMKHLKLIGVLSTLLIAAFAVINIGNTNAQTNTDTNMRIKTGVLSFYKDTGTEMNAYFAGGPNTAADISLGEHDASLDAFDAYSSGDHRFTVSDLRGKSFTVLLQSSALNGTDEDSQAVSIPANTVSYTGTAWAGTGKALTAAPTGNADIGTTPVTFVARANSSGVSKFSQEITLKVAVPAAQTPAYYTGLLTFTY